MKTIHIIFPDKSKKSIDLDNVIEELYYNLGTINKKKYNSKELISIKKELSKSDKYLPLYDIYSKNFYIINSDNVYNRTMFFHYRVPTEKIIKRLNSTLKQFTDKALDSYKEKIIKNLNFIENFDLITLEKNYFKLFYLSQPLTSELTSCIKPSFIPFITTKPYYTKSELINLGLNMNLKLDDNIENICKVVSENDINSNTILSHQMYIKQYSKAYIQLYSLLGSSYWNFYIRNKKCTYDKHDEDHIFRLYNIIKEAPKLDKQYWVYRFVDNDEYLSHLKVGDIFSEESFISCTRNPFYNTQNNIFGFILIKILLPKGKIGTGLCIESYSLFPEEEEILLNPSNLKLVSKDEKFHYYHPNSKASKKIKKLYVFEYVEMGKLPVSKNYELPKDEIPTINWLKDNLKGDDFASRVYYFYRSVLPTYNNKRYFKTMIDSKVYLFSALYLDDNPIYEQYFFLQKQSNIGKEEIYFVLHDDVTGDILLLIELRDIISVNYIHRFTGSVKLPFSDDDLILFLASMAHYFGISQVLIHDEYQSYKKISEKLLVNTDSDIFNQDNPDNHVISLYSGDFRYYNADLINHIEKKDKRFSNIPGIKFNLKSHHFQRFSKILANDIFQDLEKSPLYNILVKLNKEKQYNLLEYYIYIHYNYFYLITELNNLIINYDIDIFADIKTNPWTNSYIILNSEEYLFEKKLISTIKTFRSNIFQNYLLKLGQEHKKLSFNNYRLGLL
jgi:hypothetical protein